MALPTPGEGNKLQQYIEEGLLYDGNFIPNTGTTFNEGDVVIVEGTTTYNTTTTANHKRAIGVVQKGGLVVKGKVKINVVNDTYAIGDVLVTSTTAGKAQIDNSHDANAIALCLEAGTNPGSVTAYVSKAYGHAALVSADLPSISLASLSDTSISSPADDEFLRHNGSNWVNEAVDTRIHRVHFSHALYEQGPLVLGESGTWTDTFGTTGLTLTKDAANNGTYDLTRDTGQMDVADMMPAVGFTFQLTDALGTNAGEDDASIFIGIGNVTPSNTGGWTTLTDHHLGFRFTWSTGALTAHATNADGSTEANHDITSDFTVTNDNFFYAAFTDSSTIKYYINGTEVHSETSNLPTQITGTDDLFAIKLGAQNPSEDWAIKIGMYDVSWDGN